MHRADHHRPSRQRVALRAMLGVALLCTATAVAASNSETHAVATGTVRGRAYIDGGMDGTFSAGDTGMAGVSVRAFDTTGAEVGATTTDKLGVYALAIAAAATVELRVEFTPPTGYQPSMVTNATGAAGSSIQFVSVGDRNINFGYQAPGDYCQASLALASVCIHQGALSTDGTDAVLAVSDFSPALKPSSDPPIANDQTATAITKVSTKQSVGATWGLGWQRTTQLLWNSAVIRRHAALGPKGLGGVYVYNLSGTQVAGFDLIADKSLTLKGASDDYSDTARDIVATTADGRPNNLLSRDIPGFSGVGTAGIGDIDVSTDGAYLWVTNLYERKIHRIAIGGTASAPTLGAVQSWAVDDGHTCTLPKLRPWGLEMRNDGSAVVAAVCTNELVSPLTATSPPGEAVILALDPTETGAAAWSTLTTVNLDYTHSTDFCTTGTFTCKWKAWTNDWTAVEPLAKKPASSQYWWTQPMIVDIEELADGSFVLGMSDRMSYQGGNANWQPKVDAVPGFQTAWTAGETLLVCKTATGWAREDAGGCAGVNTYSSSRATEFFYDEFGHPETTIGGLALARGQVAVSAMDPAAYFLSGIRWVSVANGNQTNALNITNAGSTINDGFGKSAAMGDLETMCDMAPLQIGNRVWYDYDGDGIQDPGEDPVVGVTLRLYDASATLVGTAVTNAKGEYYFTSTLTEAANGGAAPDEWGGGLQPGVAYTIVMNKPEDCTTGAPLDGWGLTTNDATTATVATDQEDRIDSDATATGTAWCGSQTATVVVPAHTAGMVDHTFDIGFFKAGAGRPTTTTAPRSTTSPTTAAPNTTSPTGTDESTSADATASTSTTATTSTPTTTKPSAPSIRVSVGDYVWWDLDRDGIQDASDIPIAGVTLTIRKVDGSAVTDVNGKPVTTTVTDANGRYSFDDLPPGQYTVTVTPPANATPTKAAAGKNRAKDSSTGSATSEVLTTDGQRDPTLDFGFYRPSVSIGDRVWRDTKGDGLQNKSDKGLGGFTLSVRTVDGGPVVDVYGRPVRPIKTKSDGKYQFKDLPEGQYVVEITYPRGYIPTTPNRPDRAMNSSTLTALSSALKAGQSDMTLDFGVVRRPGEVYRLLPATR